MGIEALLMRVIQAADIQARNAIGSIFTDCGCEHVRNLIKYFIDAARNGGDSTIAICGAVAGKGRGRINRYMTEMDILNPPFEKELGLYGEKIPQAIITANALIYAPAFHQLGGFSTAFAGAGGEDLDLGIRLRELGRVDLCTACHRLPRV